MVDRIFISDDTFVTRDANNNITFSADRYYVKNDPNGNFFIGGINTVPVIAYWGSSGASINPQIDKSGWVVNNDVIWQVCSSSAPFSLSTSYTISGFVPVNTTRLEGFVLPTNSGSSLMFRVEYQGTLNTANFRAWLNNELVVDEPAEVINVAVFINRGGGPEQIGGFTTLINSLPANPETLKKGGSFKVGMSASSFSSIYITQSGVSYYPVGSNTTNGYFKSSGITWRYSPLVAIAEPFNVDLGITP